MNPASVVSRAALAAVLLVVAHTGADAQQTPATKPPPPVTKAPPRLPPNPSESARIPAGVDTGTSATSGTLPLGTPVPPTLGADRDEMRTRSAAARAAARPKLGASGADCGLRTPEAPASNKAASAAAAKAGTLGKAASAPATALRAGTDC